ncbi:MAG TPA: YdjY domain-containing protein [Pirellulaceae bacterium]|nr:YdjY domain-containing protein [Pirellulaceae bacterium]
MLRLNVFVLLTAALVLTVRGDEPKPQPPTGIPSEAANKDLVRLSEKGEIWLDLKRKAVIADGQVCLREGTLEMFACPKGTKEHESVVSLNCRAQDVHAGLLRVGAISGTPVKFDPEYKPATGTIVDIYVLWKDPDGKARQVRAQEWVKNTKTGKPLEYDWVFAGSGFWKDEETGQQRYQAEAGDLICVSNFPSATLDLPIESSQANDSLLYTVFTANVPAKGTKVRVVMIPRPKADEKKPAADNAPPK